jgi:hypothetical protein
MGRGTGIASPMVVCHFYASLSCPCALHEELLKNTH